MAAAPLAVTRYFARLQDPRRRHLRRHLLIDIIVIARCAVLCGADDWPEIATFGQRRRAWLQTFLALPNGIPSHDTFERVFDRSDPHAFLACFPQWVEALAHARPPREASSFADERREPAVRAASRHPCPERWHRAKRDFQRHRLRCPSAGRGIT